MIAFCIKTFERPDCLKRLIKSIKKFYPDAKIYIADDSKNPLEGTLKMPFDSGLAAGRNLLVDKTTEPYLLFLDDDFVFTEETKIEKFKEFLDSHPDFGIAGGALRENGNIRHFEGWLRVEGDTLYYDKIKYEGEWQEVGIVFNFMMVKREVFNYIRWDERKKLAEHTDFFLNMKNVPFKIAYIPEVIVNHEPQRPGDYSTYRNRGVDYLPLTLLERGIKKLVRFDGTEYVL